MMTGMWFACGAARKVNDRCSVSLRQRGRASDFLPILRRRTPVFGAGRQKEDVEVACVFVSVFQKAMKPAVPAAVSYRDSRRSSRPYSVCRQRRRPAPFLQYYRQNRFHADSLKFVLHFLPENIQQRSI
jgi:hypothetical protein